MHEDEPTEDNNELIEAEEVASDNRHINLKLNESKNTFQSEEDSQKLAEENVDFTLSQATIPELLTFYQGSFGDFFLLDLFHSLYLIGILCLNVRSL